jgi:hypothetical protein
MLNTLRAKEVGFNCTQTPVIAFFVFSEILLWFFDRLLCFSDTLSDKSPEKHKEASIS